MFMHKSKKGFTIVELVIVIAVIAILAAVLIPTFSNLVKKANIASDTSLAKNINTALTAYDATNGVEEFSDVIAAARDAGYIISNLNPTTEGCYFVWESSTNQILLVDSTDGYKVIYANNEKYATAGNTWYFAVRTQAEANTIKAAAGMADVNAKLAIAKTSTLNTEINNITNGDTIYIDGGIEVDTVNTIVLDKTEAKVTIDLGSSEVTGGSSDTSAEAFPFYVKAGELNLKNGAIAATAEWYDADNELVKSAVVADAGVLNIDSTNFDCPDGEILIAYGGANGTVSNATINTNISAINIGGNSEVIVENCTIDVYTEAVWVSATGGANNTKATIKSGTYTGAGNTIAQHGGTIVIEGGEFKSTLVPNIFKFYAADSTLIIKGGSFNGIAFKDLTVDRIKGLFATSTTNYNTMTIVKNADGSFTVAN